MADARGLKAQSPWDDDLDDCLTFEETRTVTQKYSVDSPRRAWKFQMGWCPAWIPEDEIQLDVDQSAYPKNFHVWVKNEGKRFLNEQICKKIPMIADD